MLVKRSTFFALILIAGLVSVSRSALAQNYQNLTFRIDSLANTGLPKSALKMVDRLDDLARKNNNAPQQIRAVIYRMTFQSYLEENALTAIINRLKTDINKAQYPVKPVLQSLLAQMYWNYYEENRYQFGQRSRLDKPDADFTKWDLHTIVNETSRLYSLSLNDAEKEQNTPVGLLDGVLQGDKSTRYLRPTLYDLLVQRAFDFFLSDEAGLPEPWLPFSLSDPAFFSDSRTFANLLVKTTDTASTQYQGIKYLQQATSFHLKGLDEEALADIDLQRLKFLYDKSNAAHKDSLYLAALKKIATAFAAKPISTEALVLEGQYYQGLDSLTTAYGFFKSAVAEFPGSLGGKNAATLIKQIEEKQLSATVEDVSTPVKPLLALVNYRNVNEAKVSVYHLSITQVQQLGGKDAWDKGYDLEPSAKVFKLLSQLQPVQAQQLSLPDPHDFRKHSAEFKIGALPVGYYVILIKEASSDKKGLVQITDFMVTHLAYSARVNPNGQTELRIVDRDSGLPLQGVKVSIYKWDYVSDNKSTRTDLFSGISDREGRYIFNNTQRESNLEKNQDLKSTLIEETPWLKDALSETEQKKRIALLFDLNKMSNELALNLDKLKKKQLPDGGFPWFGGEGSDRFITQHIVEGIGELYHLGIAGDQAELSQIADSAIKYQDRQLIADDKLEKKNKDYPTRQLNDIEIQAWFARSYFLNKPMNADLKKLLTDYLRRSADQWKFRNVYEQGMIALTLQRNNVPAVTAQIERSLLETAQQSDDLGMYWATNLQGYFWYDSPVETQSLLIEL